MLLGFLILGCSAPCEEGFAKAANGTCQPISTGGGDDTDTPADDSGGDSGDSGTDSDPPVEELPHSLGDPITTHDSYFMNSREWMDAEVIGTDRAIVAGVSGWAWYDLENTEPLLEEFSQRTYRLSLDRDEMRAYFATRASNLVVVDVSTDSPTPIEIWVPKITQGYHEDIAADGGIVLLGGLDEGLIVLDRDLERLATVEATEAFGCALLDDRGLYADGSTLILLDLSNPESPIELDRADLRGTGRDIAYDGTHVAVATGGTGVDVFSVADDALVAEGELDLPGSAFNVALDGDWLWIASWEVVGLAWLGEGGPVMVGHEPPKQSAMGLGVNDGVVAVGDWQNLTVMHHEDGLAGPEFHDVSPIWVDPNSDEPVAVKLTNWGAMDLELELTPTQGYELSSSALTLSPGGSETLQLTPPGDQGELAVISYTSNDPDEPEGQLTVRSSTTQIGSTHQDFELLGFTPPDTTLEAYQLSDYLGQVVVLVYFTTW